MKSLVRKVTNFGLGFVLVANLVDIFFTIKYIFSGVLQEANPIMEPLVEHPFLFVGVKTFLVSAGVLGLYKKSDNKLAQIGTYFCFCIYFALMLSFYYFLSFR